MGETQERGPQAAGWHRGQRADRPTLPTCLAVFSGKSQSEPFASSGQVYLVDGTVITVAELPSRKLFWFSVPPAGREAPTFYSGRRAGGHLPGASRSVGCGNRGSSWKLPFLGRLLKPNMVFCLTTAFLFTILPDPALGHFQLERLPLCPSLRELYLVSMTVCSGCDNQIPQTGGRICSCVLSQGWRRDL